MRLGHILPLATLSVAAIPASASTIVGEAKVILGGEEARCVGVALVPRTTASERSIVSLFGTASAAARTLSPAELKEGWGADYLRSKEARCSYGSGYRFANVAPGEYFVLMHARGKPARQYGAPVAESNAAPHIYETGFRQQAVLLMQPVVVTAQGTQIQSDFRYK